jgi:hypothetical protein
VLAATEVHCRLILNVRLARNQSTNKIELIFATSETEATCSTGISTRKPRQTGKRCRTRGGEVRGCSRLGRRPYCDCAVGLSSDTEFGSSGSRAIALTALKSKVDVRYVCLGGGQVGQVDGIAPLPPWSAHKETQKVKLEHRSGEPSEKIRARKGKVGEYVLR